MGMHGGGMGGFTGGGMGRMGGMGINGGGMGAMGTGMMPSIGSIQNSDCNTSLGRWTIVRPAHSGSHRAQRC
jgi:hypothetical protein